MKGRGEQEPAVAARQLSKEGDGVLRRQMLQHLTTEYEVVFFLQSVLDDVVMEKLPRLVGEVFAMALD